jgi:hypothetical protein
MSRKLSNVQSLTLWHGGDDLPPATAAKKAKPQQLVVLEKPIGLRAYPKAGQRIA